MYRKTGEQVQKTIGKMIVLENVSKTFEAEEHTVETVREVDLKIGRGEICGIIRFSGAEKSTLVRCANLLERPTSGKVYVNGVDFTELPERELRRARKKIGMIFQQH